MKSEIYNNKYALVTGGSRGIGRAICEKLAEMGYNILVNYNSNLAAAEETAQLVEQHNVKAEVIQFDVANKEQVDKNLGQWMEDHPEQPIEVLVNNAGFRNDALFMWMEEENWNSVLDVNIAGFYNVTKPVFSKMLVHRYGRIVNVVSLSGIKGMPGQTNYSAAKAAIIGATKALAQEVGRSKITVNAVAPGFIKTDMTEGIEEKQYRSIIPLRRFGTAEEVADVVAFIASPKASYITGEVISINGGLHT
ncbi:3-oxoacyl-ACP reductase FabG [Aureispira anguillae]|uniref:3-oxoacyl-ACP reductase FabG n=1 Tax=Aureispira anguillae TaxID=2864201 RepID=A0A915YLX0_9BACT|nr:3-oxoacyl-ACP reductase FabG [Aureispira anguillae]BDS15629.1 3-oxoacyl-ACP reductase FabG [Aureispira anguillae]